MPAYWQDKAKENLNCATPINNAAQEKVSADSATAANVNPLEYLAKRVAYLEDYIFAPKCSVPAPEHHSVKIEILTESAKDAEIYARATLAIAEFLKHHPECEKYITNPSCNLNYRT